MSELDNHLTRMYPVTVQDRSTVVDDHMGDAQRTITGGDTLFYARGQSEPFESVEWQDGVIDPDNGANGVTVEAMIQACIARLEKYQTTRFKCKDNAVAITFLENALGRMTLRREERFFRGVLNSHEV